MERNQTGQRAPVPVNGSIRLFTHRHWRLSPPARGGTAALVALGTAGTAGTACAPPAPLRQAPELLKAFPWDLSPCAFAPGAGLERGRGVLKAQPCPCSWGCHGDPQRLQRVLTFPRLGRNPQLQDADTGSRVGGINGVLGALPCCSPCPAPRGDLGPVPAQHSAPGAPGLAPRALRRCLSAPELPGSAARPSVTEGAVRH